MEMPNRGWKALSNNSQPISHNKSKRRKKYSFKIENDSEERISIQLKVSGDIGLSMGYQN